MSFRIDFQLVREQLVQNGHWCFTYRIMKVYHIEFEFVHLLVHFLITLRRGFSTQTGSLARLKSIHAKDKKKSRIMFIFSLWTLCIVCDAFCFLNECGNKKKRIEATFLMKRSFFSFILSLLPFILLFFFFSFGVCMFVLPFTCYLKRFIHNRERESGGYVMEKQGKCILLYI